MREVINSIRKVVRSCAYFTFMSLTLATWLNQSQAARRARVTSLQLSDAIESGDLRSSSGYIQTVNLDMWVRGLRAGPLPDRPAFGQFVNDRIQLLPDVDQAI